MASYAREPRAYELMAILLPELADEELTGAIDRVSGYITSESGSVKEILNDSPWGRRRLAYTIRYNGQDYRDGIYVIWHFDLEPTRVTEVERELKLDTRIIRYLVVHDDPKWGSSAEREQQAAAAEAAAAGPAESAATPDEAAAAGPAAIDEPAAVAEAPAATDEPAAVAEAPAAEVAEAEVTDAEVEPETPPSNPVADATGEETTAVVDDTTGAAVEAPAEETAATDSDETSDDK